MKIAVAVKVVPDDQDIQVSADRSLDYSKAPRIVSTYDLNAIEIAAQIAAANEGSVTAIAAGSKAIDDSKLKKNICARGANELVMVADDACADMDSHATAAVLAGMVQKIGDVELVICGDGSADNFAQQVDVQLACALGWPVVNAVSKLEINGNVVTAVRMLEDEYETVEVGLPVVLSVTPDVAQPRIPGMKDILAAGKKPMAVTGADSAPAAVVETVECLAPEAADRKCDVAEASAEGAIQNFAAALKAAL